MAILRKLFWLALYLVATLAFVVLFEDGTNNFGVNFQKRFSEVQGFVVEKVQEVKGKK